MMLGIVAPKFPPAIGGMERHGLGLSRALAEHCDVTVFTAVENGPHHDGIEAKNILTWHAERDTCSLLKFDVDVWLVLIACYATLARYLEKPTFVYCHGNDFILPFVDHGGWLENSLSPLSKTPFLWRAAIGRHGMMYALRRRHLREGLKCATSIFVNSEFTKAALLRQYPRLNAAEVRVSNPGVDEPFFTAAPTASRPSTERRDCLRIMTIARLQSFARKKNVDGCLRALAMIKDRLDFRYTVIGGGDDRPRLEDLSAQLGLADRVRFPGVVAHSDIPACLDESDLFLLPSNSTSTDIESFGIVYGEAAARGIPSLLSRTGGATDAVCDGVTGIIVPGPAPDHIAAGILRFARERDRFDPARIRRFAERFRWPRIAGEMWSAIESTVGDA